MYPVMYCAPNRMHDRNNVSLLREICYTKKTFELLKGYGNRSSTHESNNGGMRQKVNQETQSESKDVAITLMPYDYLEGLEKEK
jgi:hypothetical protein